MISRRTFLKMAVGLAAFTIPWTGLSQMWGVKLGNLIGRPPVKLEYPSGSGRNLLDPSTGILDRKAIEDIQELSNQNYQGRRAGTAGETKALVFLEEQFRSLQLEPFGGGNSYWQMFSISPMKEEIINGRSLFRPDENDILRIPSANILAGLLGKNEEESIIISAHYDHLGIYNGLLFPGANDNASGVGCVLQVMRRLVKEKLQGSIPKRNIVAAFWGAEEMGFLGSKHFVLNPIIPLSNLKAVINFDTVGNSENKNFILWSSRESTIINVMKEAARLNGAVIEQTSSQIHHSDESSFIGTNVPAVTILSRDWLLKNHTSEDKLSIISEGKLETACEILYFAVKKLAY